MLGFFTKAANRRIKIKYLDIIYFIKINLKQGGQLDNSRDLSAVKIVSDIRIHTNLHVTLKQAKEHLNEAAWHYLNSLDIYEIAFRINLINH